ncbi:hypothetical protein FB451DRAFT_1185878 [Mycena latifolia]|nr:hypothetical protein FB451DRAFT_1185878 [Mycena latifolia]
MKYTVVVAYFISSEDAIQSRSFKVSTPHSFQIFIYDWIHTYHTLRVGLEYESIHARLRGAGDRELSAAEHLSSDNALMYTSQPTNAPGRILLSYSPQEARTHGSENLLQTPDARRLISGHPCPELLVLRPVGHFVGPEFLIAPEGESRHRVPDRGCRRKCIRYVPTLHPTETEFLIEAAGENTSIVKAPNKDLVWTLGWAVDCPPIKPSRERNARAALRRPAS